LDGIRKERGNIILLHDAGGETRAETVKALNVLIPTLQKQGYHFTSLTNILHKSKNELMPAVPKTKAYYIMQLNLLLATVIYGVSHFLVALFMIFIGLGIVRLILMIYWAIREYQKEKSLIICQNKKTIPKFRSLFRLITRSEYCFIITKPIAPDLSGLQYRLCG
jgi:hypothetical protein